MLNNTYLKDIADALAEDAEDKKEDAGFCIEQELRCMDISLKVKGAGAITLPLAKEAVEKLIAISSKAKFGLREKTLLDENIRDTQEIAADKLQVTIDQAVMASLLDKIKQALGINEEAMITPHLHNLLIYKTGQFFNKHQDSEKLENMIATLIIVLPSPHIGGDLIVEHDKKQYVFSSENIDAHVAKCLAFYADCGHLVEKVKQGYRVALTYNLVLESQPIQLQNNLNLRLNEAVKDYFDCEESTDIPKLAYFLDHSYTEHSLRWEMLKGSDRVNAVSFLAVAKELNLVPHLALVEIHNAWSTDGREDDPELIEIIDGTTTLSYWIGLNNKSLPYDSCNITEDEICFKTELDKFEPYEEEYAGYMGNYGDTADFWYRRAAVVLWPESSQTAINFKLNYATTIKELEELTHTAGKEQTVIQIIENAGKYIRRYSDEESFRSLLKIALYVQNNATTLSMLSHFKWKILDSDCAAAISNLHDQYGTDWCIELLSAWKKQERHESLFVLEKFDLLVRKLVQCEVREQLLQFLLETQGAAIIERDTQIAKYKKPAELRKTLSQRITSVRQFLEVNDAISSVGAQNDLIAHLMSNSNLYPEPQLAELYLDLAQTIPQKSLGRFKVLKNYLIEAINTQLAWGPRSSDDWSIQIKLPCNCQHCQIAGQFLHSKTEVRKIWPIVSDIRDHIINTFHGSDIPVDLSVEKKGSPHKLVMVKNEKLHHDAQQKFDFILRLSSLFLVDQRQ